MSHMSLQLAKNLLPIDRQGGQIQYKRTLYKKQPIVQKIINI